MNIYSPFFWLIILRWSYFLHSFLARQGVDDVLTCMNVCKSDLDAFIHMELILRLKTNAELIVININNLCLGSFVLEEGLFPLIPSQTMHVWHLTGMNVYNSYLDVFIHLELSY